VGDPAPITDESSADLVNRDCHLQQSTPDLTQIVPSPNEGVESVLSVPLSADNVPHFDSPPRLRGIKYELEEHPSLFPPELELTDSSSASIDNLEMVAAGIEAIYETRTMNGSGMVALADNSTSFDLSLLPETSPHPKLLPGLSQSEVDALSSAIAKAGLAGTACGSHTTS